MKKMTESKVLPMLREAARRRYGEAYARRLLPALRETTKAILGTRAPDLALGDEPAFFSQPTRTQ